MRRVLIDGHHIIRVLSNGHTIRNDTREYIMLDDNGYLHLETSYGSGTRMLGHRSELVNGLVSDYYSPEKLALINGGIRELTMNR